MRNLMYVLSFVALLVSSCAHKNEEIEQLKKANADLRQQLALRNDEMNSFMESFNEIEENLARIRATEKIIAKQTGSGELQGNRLETVKSDIQAIAVRRSKIRKPIPILAQKRNQAKAKKKEC